MISPRRAALLGLTTPLNAIMIAVLGLWPETSSPVVVEQEPWAGGADSGPRAPSRPDWELERSRAGREKQLEDELSIALGIIMSGVLECH